MRLWGAVGVSCLRIQEITDTGEERIGDYGNKAMDSSATTLASKEGAPLEKVLEAWKVLRPALWPTHLLRCAAIDEVTGYKVWLKPENLQRTGSYKIRGAYYKLHQLKRQKGTKRVVAASAGNHAQGVAYAARELGMDCVIVMPQRAPLPKRRATKSYGAEVLLQGDSFDDALAFALDYAPAENREFISPYDDLDVISGQGTVAWEILEEMKDSPPGAILVPVGGGGLVSGIASVLKQVCPASKLIAVQSSCAPAFVRSWEANREHSEVPLPLNVPTQETIADGVRVRQPGKLCWQISKDAVDLSVSVDDAQVYQGILMLAEQAKLVAEGAGALAVSALIDPVMREKMTGIGVEPGARVAVIVSGGNIDSLTLHRVMARSMAVNGREQSLGVRIKDEPGEMEKIIDFLRRKRASVLDLRRSWQSQQLLSETADIELLIETEDEAHGQEILQELAEEAKKGNFELLPGGTGNAPPKKFAK